jgi:hypothetical protein
MFTNISGDDVPNDTTVNPITRSEIWNRLAIDEAPSTRKSALLMRSINPIMRSTYGSITVISRKVVCSYYESIGSIKFYFNWAKNSYEIPSGSP